MVAVVEREGRYLLYLNEEPGLLSGLWQFPTRMVRSPERTVHKTRTEQQERKALKEWVRQGFAMAVQVEAPLPQQKYLFTHISATLKPYLCSLIGMGSDLPEHRKVRWVKLANFSRYPISTAMRKIAALIRTARAAPAKPPRPEKFLALTGRRVQRTQREESGPQKKPLKPSPSP
jgi:adenine-specific DNA glycosylase